MYVYVKWKLKILMRKSEKKTFFIKLVTWLLQKHSQVSFEKVNGRIFVI
jgi:hypothetical protein